MQEQGKANYQDRTYIEELEKKFWSSMYLEGPVYGADTEGSLFDEGLCS